MFKRKAFTLVEILVVVSILGIFAAVVIPVFNNHVTAAKEGVAKDHLRFLRSAAQLYTVQHHDVPPGYPGGDLSKSPSFKTFMEQMLHKTLSDGKLADANSVGELVFGPYLTEIPKNPFNDGVYIEVLGDIVAFPIGKLGALSNDTIKIGWIYSPAKKEFKINHDGLDSEGIPFSSY